MHAPRDLRVVRNFDGTRALLRSAAEGGSASDVMTVRFSPFNTWYEIDSFFEGNFLERTAPGAFAAAINAWKGRKADQSSPVKVLFNHGFDVLGDQLLGTITDLREDSDAAVGEVNLFDGLPDLLMSGLRAGAYGSSFMFEVLRDEWDEEPGTSDWNPGGIPERTVREVRLYEFGPVTFPANPAATSGLRSTDDYYANLEKRRPQLVADIRSRILASRTPATDAVRSDADTSDPGAAEGPTVTPAESHLTGLTSSQRRARLLDLITGNITTPFKEASVQ